MGYKIKRILSYILIFIMVFSAFPMDSISIANTTNEITVQKMIGQGYEESIRLGVSDIYYLNPHIYNEQQRIVYSANSSSTNYQDLRSTLPVNQGANNIDKDGDYRYLGYNENGDIVSNGLFEPDVSPFTGHLNERDWVEHSTAENSWRNISDDIIDYMLNTEVEISSSNVGTDTITNILGGVGNAEAKKYAIFQTSPGLNVQGSVDMWHDIGDKILYWTLAIPKLSKKITNQVSINNIDEEEVMSGDSLSVDFKTTHDISLDIISDIGIDAVSDSYVKTIEIINKTNNKKESIEKRYSITSDFVNDTKTESYTFSDSDLNVGINRIQVEVRQELKPKYAGDSSLFTSATTDFNIIKLEEGDIVPSLRIEVDPNTIKKGESGNVDVKLVGTLSGTEIVPTAWKFYLDGQVIHSNSGNGTYSYTTSTETTIDTDVIDVNNLNGKVDIYLNSSDYVTATATETVEVYEGAEPDNNTPPYGYIGVKRTIELNESINPLINFGDKEDPREALEVGVYLPDSATGHVDRNGGEATFTEIGEYQIVLTVKDTNGASFNTHADIEVIPPQPNGSITVNGNQTEYRKIDISLSNSSASTNYPIDWSKSELEIIPLDGQDLSKIYIHNGSAITTNKSFVGKNDISLQANETGRIRIKGTVYNNIGEFDVVSKTLDIVEDIKPVVTLDHLAMLYRDPSKSNKAYLDAYSNSYSPDGDNISNVKLYLRYDDDNDGVYTDEGEQIFYNGVEKKSFVIPNSEVGKRQLRLVVTETYESLPTLPAPKLSSEITTIYEVDNIAPSVETDIDIPKQAIEVKYLNANNYNTGTYLNNHFNNLLKPYLSQFELKNYETVNTNTNGYMRNVQPIKHLVEDDINGISSIAKPQKLSDNYYKIGHRHFYIKDTDMLFYYQNYRDEDENVGSLTPFINPDEEVFFIKTDLQDTLDDNATGYVKYFVNGAMHSFSRYGDYENMYFFNKNGTEIGHIEEREVDSNFRNIMEDRRTNVTKIDYYGPSVVVGNYAYFKMRAKINDEYMTLPVAININNNNYIKVLGSPVRYNYTAENVGFTLVSRNGVKYAKSKRNNNLYRNQTNYGALSYDFEYNNFTSNDTFSYSRDSGVRHNNILNYDETLHAGGSFEYHYDREYHVWHKLFIDKTYNFRFTNVKASGYGTDTEGYLEKYDWANNLNKNLENMSFDDTIQSFIVIYLKDYVKFIGDSKNLNELTNILLDKNVIPLFVDTNNQYLDYFDSVITPTNGITVTSENDIAQAIENNVNQIAQIIDGAIYITKDVGLKLSSLYSDYENDPQFDSRFVVNHIDPNYFENSEGVSQFDGQTVSSNNTLDKVGKYYIQGQVQDDPTYGNSNLASYRYWSKTKNKIPVFIHRPSTVDVQLGFTLTGSGYDITVADNSFDPDHQSTINKGITDRKYLWKEENDTIYQTSIPSSVPSGNYTLIAKERDTEGLWSTKVYNYELTGADVSIDLNTTLNPSYPSELKTGDSLTINSTVNTNFPVSYVRADLNGLKYDLIKQSQSGNTSIWRKTLNIPDKFSNGDYEVKTVAENNLGVQDNDIDFMKIQNNQAPTVNIISALPTTKYAGDNINLVFKASDPDNQDLNYQISIDNNVVKTGTISTSQLGINQTIKILDSSEAVSKNGYNVEIIVTDPMNEKDNDVTTFNINSLIINSSIKPIDPMRGENLIIELETATPCDSATIDVPMLDYRTEIATHLNGVKTYKEADGNYFYDLTSGYLSNTLEFVTDVNFDVTLSGGSRLRPPYTITLTVVKNNYSKMITFPVDFEGDVRETLKVN